MRSGSPSRRLLTRLTAIGLILLLLWAGLDLNFVLDGAETDYATPADAIVLLGCHVAENGGLSTCIRTRSEHAAALYNQGYAPHIIATGGQTDGAPISEGQVMANLLVESGVPAENIVVEDRARNTIQNIVYSKEIMLANGWDTALLVTEPSHIKRATLIARDNGLTVFPSPATASPNWSNWYTRFYNVGRDTLSLMLYQVKRLLGINE